MEKTAFTVTKRAGPKVAGQFVSPGQHLELTEDEARQDLADGSLVRKGEQLNSAFTKTTEAVAAAQHSATETPSGEDAPPPGDVPPGNGKPGVKGGSKPA